MSNFSLDKRLAACAELVLPGDVVCDVGTDHGLLPVWLVLHNVANYAVACDINPLPLKSAEENIKKYGLSHKISTVLSDGLKDVPSQDITCVVCAGMGGETISGIVTGCDWVKNCTLILQPMTRIESMRQSLAAEGWREVKTLAVIDGRYAYAVTKWVFDGSPLALSPSELVCGKLDFRHSAGKAYLERQIERLKKSAEGKISSKDKATEGREEMALVTKLEKLLAIDEENTYGK